MGAVRNGLVGPSATIRAVDSTESLNQWHLVFAVQNAHPTHPIFSVTIRAYSARGGRGGRGGRVIASRSCMRFPVRKVDDESEHHPDDEPDPGITGQEGHHAEA